MAGFKAFQVETPLFDENDSLLSIMNAIILLVEL